MSETSLLADALESFVSRFHPFAEDGTKQKVRAFFAAP
jgi:hypothetical protein